MKTKVKPNRPLTYKQKEFIKQVVENPKQSLTKAAQAAYSSGDKEISPTVAAQIAYDNMRKPNIVSQLQDYTQLVETTLTNTVAEWGQHERPRQREIAQQAAMYIHDKVHGKATQRVETRSEAVVISIDLTGSPTE
jgi:hypothetical protein